MFAIWIPLLLQILPMGSLPVAAGGGGGGAAVAFRSSSTVTYGARTNTTITAPAGIVNGDLLVIYFAQGGNGVAAPTAPTGFSTVTGFPNVVTDGNGFSVRSNIWYKVASSESGNYVVTHNASSTEAYMFAASGGSTTGLSATINSGTGSTSTATGITTTKANALVLFVAQDWADTANTLTAPSGYTKRFGGTLTLTADIVQASAGATGNQVITNNSSGTNPWSAYLLKIETP